MEVNIDFFNKLVDMVSLFNKNKTFELEAKAKYRLTTAEFASILQYLRSVGYEETIHPEVLDIFSANVRVSLSGKEAISEYCKTNTIRSSDKLAILSKKNIQSVHSLDYDDGGVKVKSDG